MKGFVCTQYQNYKNTNFFFKKRASRFAPPALSSGGLEGIIFRDRQTLHHNVYIIITVVIIIIIIVICNPLKSSLAISLIHNQMFGHRIDNRGQPIQRGPFDLYCIGSICPHFTLSRCSIKLLSTNAGFIATFVINLVLLHQFHH